MNLRLKPGEKIYINGAVIRVDRRVSLELLNDVTFLLQSHVLQVEDATTPLRQLYFMIQSVLIDPKSLEHTELMIVDMLNQALSTFSNRDVIDGLLDVRDLTDKGRFYEALRIIRSLFPLESLIMNVGISVDVATV
jgi:flagellar biosynthesis repressor protein FlbT